MDGSPESANGRHRIEVIRSYPVYKGETEAQALKRKIAEEAAWETKGKEEAGVKNAGAEDGTGNCR